MLSVTVSYSFKRRYSNVGEPAKLCVLPAKNELTCQHDLCGYVFTCHRVSCAYVLTCQGAMSS